MAIRWCRYRYQWPVSSGPESGWQEVLATGHWDQDRSCLSFWRVVSACERRVWRVECGQWVSACYRGDYCARKLECFAEQNVECCYLHCHFRSTSLAWLVFSNFCWDFSLARWASQSSLAEWRQDWARPVSGPLVPDLRSPVCGSETRSQWRCDEAR